MPRSPAFVPATQRQGVKTTAQREREIASKRLCSPSAQVPGAVQHHAAPSFISQTLPPPSMGVSTPAQKQPSSSSTSPPFTQTAWKYSPARPSYEPCGGATYMARYPSAAISEQIGSPSHPDRPNQPCQKMASWNRKSHETPLNDRLSLIRPNGLSKDYSSKRPRPSDRESSGCETVLPEQSSVCGLHCAPGSTSADVHGSRSQVS